MNRFDRMTERQLKRHSETHEGFDHYVALGHLEVRRRTRKIKVVTGLALVILTVVVNFLSNPIA